MSTLDALIELQAIDVRLTQLEHRLATLPERQQQTDLDAAIASVDERIGVVEKDAEVLRRQQRRDEDEVAGIEAKIANSERHLYDGGMTSPKEAQALQEEIASLARRKDDVEDQVLEVMEQLEPLEEELGRLATQRTGLETEHTEVSARLAELSAEIEQLTDHELTERGARVAEMPADLVQIYEQRRRAMRGGVAVARLNGASCGSCHLEISAVELEVIKGLPAGELGECPECGALVVP